MITCTRRLLFCAGHRVVGHENKCANVHGHNYEVEVTAVGDLDNIGRVIDFSVLKSAVGGWIEKEWDHTFIAAPNEDDLLIQHIQRMGNKKIFFLTSNPTAENLAEYLLKVVCPDVLGDSGVKVIKVVVHETPNCKATAELFL